MNDPVLVITGTVVVQGLKQSHDITQTALQTLFPMAIYVLLSYVGKGLFD